MKDLGRPHSPTEHTPACPGKSLPDGACQERGMIMSKSGPFPRRSGAGARAKPAEALLPAGRVREGQDGFHELLLYTEQPNHELVPGGGPGGHQEAPKSG